MVAQAISEASKKAKEPKKADEVSARHGDDAVDLAPSLAPTEAQLFGDADVSPERPLGPVKRNEQSSPVPHGESFGVRPKLIVGAAIGAALLICAFAYFFRSSKDENTASQTAQSAPTVPTPAPPAPTLAPASPTQDSSITPKAAPAQITLPSASLIQEGSSTPPAALPSARSTQTAVPPAASAQAPNTPPSARSPSAPSQTALPAARTQQGPSAATPAPFPPSSSNSSLNQPNAVRAPATANTGLPETASQGRNVLFSAGLRSALLHLFLDAVSMK